MLGVIGKDFGSPEKKVAAIRDAVESSGVCAASACMRTRDELLRRVDQATHFADGQLSLESSECYQVGCVAVISSRGPSIELALDHLRKTGQTDWPVPTIFGRPVAAADGAETALWVFFNQE